MNTETKASALRAARWISTLLLTAAANLGNASELVTPVTLVVDQSLPAAQAQQQILAARRYDTFWNTGDEAMARAALAADFRDNTLPPGRAQGVEGPLKASRAFRAAVPDLRCEVLQMIVAGDRVTAALRFTGHFTGTLGEHQGQGQAIDFIAMDIYRIADGRIAEDWHLEDNLAFMRQAGLVGL
ncbi:ester cyclase [Pseudomonas carassii]|uniref:Ester cyclase n=1 Tax=Pseudomonas carassii TaxID=3115855 RepID=A0ABU7HBC6_9PSED|nr:ester cyclase [Pseudomonas sp. 137P]MEE1888612.1 ester cyclase [Pseudomonas sp. 137P]